MIQTNKILFLGVIASCAGALNVGPGYENPLEGN